MQFDKSFLQWIINPFVNFHPGSVKMNDYSRIMYSNAGNVMIHILHYIHSKSHLLSDIVIIYILFWMFPADAVDAWYWIGAVPISLAPTGLKSILFPDQFVTHSTSHIATLLCVCMCGLHVCVATYICTEVKIGCSSISHDVIGRSYSCLLITWSYVWSF